MMTIAIQRPIFNINHYINCVQWHNSSNKMADYFWYIWFKKLFDYQNILWKLQVVEIVQFVLQLWDAIHNANAI